MRDQNRWLSWPTGLLADGDASSGWLRLSVGTCQDLCGIPLLCGLGPQASSDFLLHGGGGGGPSVSWPCSRFGLQWEWHGDATPLASTHHRFMPQIFAFKGRIYYSVLLKHLGFCRTRKGLPCPKHMTLLPWLPLEVPGCRV